MGVQQCKYARLRFQNARRNLEDDWDVEVFLPPLNKQSVHLIQRFYEKKRNGINLQPTGCAFVLKDTRFRTNKSILVQCK